MREKGQSLFEVIIALAVSALIIVALVSLVSNAVRNATFSKNKTAAATYTQEATEWLRGQRDSDIDTFFTNAASPLWCLKDLSWSKIGACDGDTDFISGTPFIREVSFSKTLEGGKTLVEAGVAVSWTDSQGIHEVTSATNFSDWRQK